MPRDEWVQPGAFNEALSPRFGDVGYHHPGPDGEPVYPDICPGYLAAQRWAVEATEAYSAKGELRDYFPGMQNTVCEAALTLQSSLNAYERYRAAELKKKE